LKILKLSFFIQVAFSATVSRLLPLQLGFERFLIKFAKIKVSRSMCGPHYMSFSVQPCVRQCYIF